MSTERHASTYVPPAEENAMFLDILHESPLFGHRKPTSIVGSVLYCLLLAGYAILAAGAPWIFRPIRSLLSPLLSSCGVILLIVTEPWHFHGSDYSFHRIDGVRRHLSAVSGIPSPEDTVTALVGNMVYPLALDLNVFGAQTRKGYYVFSQKLKHIVRLPFAATAYGTAAMLLVIVWKPHISILSITVLLRIIMLIEVVCAGFFMSAYIGYIYQYNSLDSQPDVLKSLYSPLQPSSSLEGLRYHDGGRLADQQMALLQYQRENLHFLSEEILRLQESLSKYERSNDGNTPQVDLAHLLAARDQELRTLSAEMNQLQSELRLARSLIAERDSEIQHVRTTNNQYVEENERLRAILGEWSTRAAKLERALEAERMSNLELQKKVLTVRNQPTHESAEPS